MHLREPTSVPRLALTVLIIGFVLLVRLDLVTSKILLAFIFLAAAAWALVTPVWQSIVPLLVSRTLLQPAIALNGVGVNVSRAIGLISGASIFSAKHSKSMLFLAFGLIVLHRPHRRLTRIDELQRNRGLAENADDGGLFAAALDAVIVRGVGDAAHEAA